MSSSKFADEGTIAHALAAMCLTEGKAASAYIGRLIKSEDYEHASLSPSGAARWMRCAGSHALEGQVKFVPRTFSLQVTEEMAEGVQIYLDNLATYRENAVGEYMVEQKLPVDHLTGEEGATGSGDYIILDYNSSEIQVHDLKFGRGVEVLADDNEQLMMYLSGALKVFDEFAPPGGWKSFRGVIHQPRISPVPSVDVWTLEELRAFEERCKFGAARANMTKGLPKDTVQQYLEPGEKQCKFCDAKATCPALKNQVTKTVLEDFESLDDVATVPVPQNVNDLARYLKLVPLIEQWCAAVTAHAEAEILAGRPVPGFKAVQGKRGNRKWTADITAEEVMKSMRLKHDVMYDYSVISPTTAEKRLKDHPKQWKRLEALITQAEGKPTVVPESDKRAALTIRPVIEDFQSLEDNAEELV